MNAQLASLVDELACVHALPLDGYRRLIEGFDAELAAYTAERAVALRRRVYGNKVFVRGLIEVSNYCANDCSYCGIHRSNSGCERYRLTPGQILDCADAGYELGFRTFVLQGGEDPWFTDERLTSIIRDLKAAHPDCAVTLSLGERSRESYHALAAAGADRYLLRQEAADARLYAQLHPAEMSHANRLRCLEDLAAEGFVVGCGFMVGVPGQTAEHLAADLKFIEELEPGMCGIGPFVPHHATAFADEPAGSVGLTCFLLSLLRLIKPNLLLPATTALGTLDPQGREKGMQAGANVVMPNLSPADVRDKYELYDNKLHSEAESGEGFDSLKSRMAAIGYEVVIDRGDPAEEADDER